MSDYKDTLNLPKTAFSMKANLAQREPQFLQAWQDGDIYGRHVQVVFIARLRDERRFESVDALQQQIGADVHQARALFTDQGEQISHLRVKC